MAFRDGGAPGGSIAPLYGYAVAAKGTWFAGAMYPEDNERPSQLKPTLTAAVSAVTAPSSVQWDVATDSGFTSIIWTLTETVVPNGVRSVIMSSTLTNLTKYYWRVRAGDGAGVWGPFSATRSFTPDLNAGRGYAAIFENVGFEPPTNLQGTFDAMWNTGVEDLRKSFPVDTHYKSVMPPDLRKSEDVQFMYEGDVNTNTPTPHIWFLDPNAAREGDGFKVYGFGAGPTQATYSGLLERFDPAVGWISVPVVTWTVYPETANAYGPARILDPDTAQIDMQHLVIEAVIPPGALPPGFGLRIRTNGA